MDPIRFQKVKEIVADALELERPQRDALVAERCGEGEETAREVMRLLSAHDNAQNDFLDAPTGGPLKRPPSLGAGRRIGSWQLVSELGSGGMGVVYLAERHDADFHQRAALKVMRLATTGDALAEGFQRERQVLARLEHPNIARLLDGGTTAEGLPYLAMECVEGRPIDRYCEEEGLSIDGRIELFRSVCAAVGHAHRSLIVHRDIKPSNILVTHDGAPKLLDFGIAKLLDDGPGEPAITRIQALTPEYASPEQLEGGAITTASDVYSLGALLYHLLTGHPPFPVGRKSFPELLRQRAGAPSPPSGEVTGSEARRLRGDLDSIVLCALRRDPERRYRSTEELADDLERYLTGFPVRARSESLRYRVSKYARRNWLPLTAAGLVFVTVSAAASVATWQARVAQSQRDRADDNAQRTDQVNRFLVDLLAAPGGRWWRDLENKGPETRVIDVIDEAAARLETDLERAPLQRASLHQTLNDTYLALGMIDRAFEQVRLALEIRTRELGAMHPNVAESSYYLASTLRAQYRLSEALAAYERAIDIERQLPQPTSNFSYALSEGALCAARLGLHDEAARWIDEALAIDAEEGSGRAPTDYLLVVRALLKAERGELLLADEEVDAAQEAFAASHDPVRPNGLFTTAEFVSAWLGGDLDRALERSAPVRGGSWLGWWRAQALFDAGRYEEAEPLLDDLDPWAQSAPEVRVLRARLALELDRDSGRCLELGESALVSETSWSRGPSWYLAEARSAVAACLLERRQEGDVQRATELSSSARATLDELYVEPTPLHSRLPVVRR